MELEPADLHVMPINDIKDHATTRECWCSPSIEPPYEWCMDDVNSISCVVVHNSLDRREDYEKCVH